MISFDTNLLVRLATNDEPAERDIVIRLIDENRVLIPVTVILETEWVLRSLYDYSSTDFCSFVRFLDGLSNITIDKVESVRNALLAHEQGCDFADALHAFSQENASLYTFDKKLAKQAKKLGIKVELAS